MKVFEESYSPTYHPLCVTKHVAQMGGAKRSCGLTHGYLIIVGEGFTTV